MSDQRSDTHPYGVDITPDDEETAAKAFLSIKLVQGLGRVALDAIEVGVSVDEFTGTARATYEDMVKAIEDTMALRKAAAVNKPLNEP